MCDEDSWCCITRVVDGAGHEVQLAQVHWVLRRIQSELGNLPTTQRNYLGTALLHSAVSQLLFAQGRAEA